MSGPSYIVLRAENRKAETIGPRATVFNSFKKADEYAKALRDRYTHQTFIVCQAVAVYEVHLAATVKALLSDGREAGYGGAKRQSGKPAKPKFAETAGGKNIVEMRSR